MKRALTTVRQSSEGLADTAGVARLTLRPMPPVANCRRYLLAALALTSLAIGMEAVADEAAPGSETASTTEAVADPKGKPSTFSVISSALGNAQRMVLGDENEDLTQTKGPEDVQGPSEPLYSRLGLAMTNLGHLSEQLLPTAEDARTSSGDSGSKVIGSDSRTQVTATTSYPWRAICHLSVKWPNGQTTGGSGFFISSRTVMTAGHVIYNPSRGGNGWATQVTVSAGRNGSSYPYGKVTVGSSALWSVKGYVEQGQKPAYDFGAVVLPSTTPGASTGWFGYHAMSSSEFSKWTFNIAGYPGDKSSGTMWTATGPITGTMDTVTTSSGAVAAGRVKHTVDTFDGESGSPIWYLTGSSRYVVGVHTGGNSSYNWGSRMGQDMVNFIKGRP